MKTTYEAWLNDRLPGKLEASNDLTTLCAEKLISQEDYNKIRKAQEGAFDASFTMALETFKRINSVKISKDYSCLKGIRDHYKLFIDRNRIYNPTMFDGVMLGGKCLDGIKGSQYLEIKAFWKDFEKGKKKYVTIYLNDYHKLFTKYSIYQWLKEQEQPKRDKPEFNLRKIALIYFYTDKQITRENGNEIAEKYDYNSGEKLFQWFTHYSSRANRIGTEGTERKTFNKIKLFETVIQQHLKPNSKAKQKAVNELNTLKANSTSHK